MHTTNYFNTFIEVSEDCPVHEAIVPPNKNEEKSLARLEYELLSENPYIFTSDDIIFQVHAMRKGIPAEELEASRGGYFSKGRPCMRSSPLSKRYGWGTSHDAAGRVALVASGTPEYMALLSNPALTHKKALRNAK